MCVHVYENGIISPFETKLPRSQYDRHVSANSWNPLSEMSAKAPSFTNTSSIYIDAFTRFGSMKTAEFSIIIV